MYMLVGRVKLTPKQTVNRLGMQKSCSQHHSFRYMNIKVKYIKSAAGWKFELLKQVVDCSQKSHKTCFRMYNGLKTDIQIFETFERYFGNKIFFEDYRRHHVYLPKIDSPNVRFPNAHPPTYTYTVLAPLSCKS